MRATHGTEIQCRRRFCGASEDHLAEESVRLFAAILVLMFASGSPAWGQRSDDAQRCAKISDPDQRLPFCIAAIESGKLSAADLAVTLNNRGLAYQSQGDYERAIQDYDQAVRLNPSYADAFINRGGTYHGQGDYERAIQDYDQAVRLKPSFAIAFNNRGLAYQSQGNYERAIQDYDQAIRLNPSHAGAFINRGNAYGSKRDYERAIQDYDQAIRLNPSYADAFRNRGYARFYLGQFVVAEPDFAKVLELSPSYPDSALWLYLARSRAGQNARSELEKDAARLKLTAWPGPVIDLYLGKTTPGAILTAAGDSDAKKDREHHCEAYFYLGEHALIGGKGTEAKGLFQQAIDTAVTSLAEYAGAQTELNRLSAGQAQGPQAPVLESR
jgi:lipoprotein NlpI